VTLAMASAAQAVIDAAVSVCGPELVNELSRDDAAANALLALG
jgi:hypothetical protein